MWIQITLWGHCFWWKNYSVCAKNKLSQFFFFELLENFYSGQDLYPPTILSFCLLGNVFVLSSFLFVCFLKDSFAISDSWLTGFFFSPFGLCYPIAFCPPLLLMRSQLLIFIEFLTNGKSFFSCNLKIFTLYLPFSLFFQTVTYLFVDFFVEFVELSECVVFSIN